MSEDSSQVVVPGIAHVRLAVVGSTVPADESAAPAGAWRLAGLSTEDGTAFTGNPTFNEVRSHQSPYATRVFKSTDDATLALVLQQFNGPNLIAQLGGGTLTTVSAGHFKYVPPAATTSTPVAAMLDWSDTYIYRLVIPKCRVRSGVNIPVHRTAEIQLPLNLQIEGASGTDPWILLTNDPEFDPAATG